MKAHPVSNRDKKLTHDRHELVLLVRFAHPPEAENKEMLESWNDGFKETSIQNAYYFIDFLVLMDYFSGKNQKINAWRASSQKVDSTFLVG